MIDHFYLAWRYLIFHRARSAVIVASLLLVSVLPIALERILGETERQLLNRSATTPLLVGAKGSALDLVMSSVYFGGRAPEPISLAEIEQVEAEGLAYAIPIHTGFTTARGAPIVGTTVDYFDFRKLAPANGRTFTTLGESVLGAQAASRLGLGPGDALVSSPESLFDLAGAYPLKTRVVGVLAPSGTPDDLAVFVDTKTAWVMLGIGHGHQDLEQEGDPTLVISRDDERIVSSAKVRQYQEITEANRDSFHFHGDASGYPLSAALIVPRDERSGTLLLGRFVDGSLDAQLIRPQLVIEDVMNTIFRIKNVLDLAVGVVAVAATLALLMVFTLSFQLRQDELRTNFEMGASRGTAARLLLAEVILLATMTATLAAGSIMLLDRFSATIVRGLIVS